MPELTQLSAQSIFVEGMKMAEQGFEPGLVWFPNLCFFNLESWTAHSSPLSFSELTCQMVMV